MELVIITPSHNAGANMEALCASIDLQDDKRWRHIIIDDCSEPGKQVDLGLATRDVPQTREVRLNTERKWALRNIIDVAREYQDRDDVIIGTVDGDDQLLHSEVVRWIIDGYEQNPEVDVIWTAHQWDIREDMNVSRPMPQNVDPYEYPWCSSHFRTFRASLLRQISDDNFKDVNGEWFKRGYDQALMLPVLHVGRGRGFINKPCYLYKMDSVSIPLSERGGTEVEQIHNIAFVRARGFVG